MDAALDAKVADIAPHLIPGLIVDRGCGTGAMMSAFARGNRKVVGIEISDALSHNHAGVIQADIIEPVFANGFVENIVLSSVMHEVYSYNDYRLEPVRRCLQTCALELSPGGRVIIRDIWSPEGNAGDIELTLDVESWDRLSDLSDRTPMPLEITARDPTRRAVQMSMRTAVEFLAKRDYVHHWDLEIREVYTALPLSTYRTLAADLGLDVVVAEPIRNRWIIDNRWRRNIEGNVPEFTNQLIVLEKPVAR